MLIAQASPLGKVFAVYAAFWSVVIIGLLIGVGALLRKQEKILRERGGDSHGPH
jgi:hypothetical protein